ncbi:MAG: hypothetical protein INF91_01070 [Alphaproteobacteria bacterium]|nr:hypothetical protein [Alphaproteobacteria bacterium]
MPKGASRAALVLTVSMAAGAPALGGDLPVRVTQPDTSRLTIASVSVNRTDAGVMLDGSLIRPLGIRGSTPGRVRMQVYVAGVDQPLCTYASRGGFNRVGMPRARFHAFIPIAGDARVTQVNVALTRNALADPCSGDG